MFDRIHEKCDILLGQPAMNPSGFVVAIKVPDQSEFVGLIGWDGYRAPLGEQVARKAATSRFVARVWKHTTFEIR